MAAVVTGRPLEFGGVASNYKQACSGRQRLLKIHIRSHFRGRFKVMTAIEKTPLIINALRKACHYLRTVSFKTLLGDDTHLLQLANRQLFTN